VTQRIEVSLRGVHVQAGRQSAQARAQLQRELTCLDVRMGTIPREFWQRKHADWQTEEHRIKSLIGGLDEGRSAERLLDVRRILELALNAHSLCLTRKPTEQD
jgi:hypothetical protein